MTDAVADSVVRHGLLVLLPIAAALLLRWARCPGWHVVGGLTAGLLLGPSFFGALWPEMHEQLYRGGAAERVVMEDLEHELERELTVLQHAGAMSEAIQEQLKDYPARMREAQASYEEARWDDQVALRLHMALVVALAMLGGGMLAVRSGDRRQGLLTPVSIGAWSAALPGALAFVCMTRWWGHSWPEAAAAAAAVSIGPWVLTKVDREAADAAEIGGARMIQTAGRIATVMALPVFAWGLAAQRGVEGLLWALPLLGVAGGWLLPKKGTGISLRELLEIVLLPALAACVAVKADLFHHFAIWPVIIFILLSDDARWLGAFLGAMLPGGRKSLRTMRLVLGSMACGPTQLAVAAVAIHCWSLPAELPLALVAGAAVIELTTPARRIMARRLAETEEEIAEMEEDDT